MKTTVRYFIAIGSFSFIFINITGCKGNKDSADTNYKSDTVWVNAVNPTFKNISKPVIASGILTTRDEVALSFKTPGIIEDIKVDEGQFVKKGQLLAALDVTEINAVYSQAKINYEKTKRDYERAQKLYDDSVATREQMQNAQSALDAAKASLEQVDYNLKHSFIYAPGDGYVLKKLANPGELRAAGTPIIFLGNTNGNEWSLKVGVSDKEMVQLSLADSSYITVDAYPCVQFKGRIKEIGTFPEKETGVYPVEIRFNSNKNKLAYGFSAKVKIIPSISSKRVLLPLEALVYKEEMQATVWKVDKSYRVCKHLVNIDFILDNMAAIQTSDEQFVKPEDLIITKGQNRLSDNSFIKVIY